MCFLALRFLLAAAAMARCAISGWAKHRKSASLAGCGVLRYFRASKKTIPRMARSKLRKFAENEHRPNVIQEGKEFYAQARGRWRSDYFRNDRPIVLELACGRGEYTVGLASHYPHLNFIGIDMKGDRIWKGSGQALEMGLDNVAFLRCHISKLLEFFAPGEVDDIWLVFPDPRPKDRDERRRLTNPRYLNLYRELLRPGGQVRLKTDSPLLFDYTLDVLQSPEIAPAITDLVHTRALYESEWAAEHHGIVTRYEREFSAKGFSIKYLKFRFAPAPDPV
jgi:tRNA (guanine-N7-)-methyltransferase